MLLHDDKDNTRGAQHQHFNPASETNTIAANHILTQTRGDNVRFLNVIFGTSADNRNQDT